MKLRNLVLVLFAAATLHFTSALADHTLPSGSIARLKRDTYDLGRAVQYSTIAYQVKSAFSRFSYDVSRFISCVQQRPQERDHDLIPSSCEYDLDRLHSSWYPVERYLYDTNYDYPNVYYRYLSVRRDMQALPH